MLVTPLGSLFSSKSKKISQQLKKRIIGLLHIRNTQKTIDKSGKDTDISTKGRHDPCVGIRAVPVGEAMMACVLADHFLRNRAQNG